MPAIPRFIALPSALRDQGGQLLHRALRGQPVPRGAEPGGVGPGAGAAHREAKVRHHGRPRGDVPRVAKGGREGERASSEKFVGKIIVREETYFKCAPHAGLASSQRAIASLDLATSRQTCRSIGHPCDSSHLSTLRCPPDAAAVAVCSLQ